MDLVSFFSSTANALGLCLIGYLVFLALLTIPFFQDHAIYLHSMALTWFKDINAPEQWGFLRNQVTPFTLSTPDGVTLHAWHVLPLELYRQHEQELVNEPEGIATDIRERLSFKLLRDDPNSLLVLYLHGAAGTLGSGWRPPSYRAMLPLGGILTDALTLADWAMREAGPGIPASRIVLFGQSLGTAVAISLAHHLATRPDNSNPILFAGMVLVAPFADVELLTATYRIAGTIPLLGPLAPFPRLLTFFNTFILSKWPSKDRLADFVRACERMPGDGLKYHVTIIHAQDDYDIPWSHSDQLFWHAVNATRSGGIGFEELEREKDGARTVLSSAGWVAEERTAKGVVREEITRWGLHDRIMSFPVVSLAVLRAFHARESGAVEQGREV